MFFQSSIGRQINGPPVPVMADRHPVTSPMPASMPRPDTAPPLLAGLRKQEIPAKATQADTMSESGPAGITGAASAPANAPGTIARRKIQSLVRRRVPGRQALAAATTPASTKLARLSETAA